MSKYHFSAAERYAVYETHGDTCYLCTKPIDMASFQVDHIIPEQLLSAPQQLAKVLKTLNLPQDFDINSFENWMPACGPCNNMKRARIFSPSPLIQLVLDNATNKAGTARTAMAKTVKNQALSRAANTIARAIEEGHELTDQQKAVLQPLLERFALAHASEPVTTLVRVTPTYQVPLLDLLELLADDGRTAIGRGPFGVGGGPSLGPGVLPHMACVCGSTLFNGSRCIQCGTEMDD